MIDKKLILMQKPITPTVLAAKVREVLDKRNAPEKPAAIAQDLSGMRILYADDDESSRLLVSTYLEPSHCILDICVNGQAAVDKFQSGSYALVLMDMQMPVMDGLTASQAIRSWETARGLKATPVIAMTGFSGKDEVKAILDAGCTSLITKPIEREVLLQAVSSFFSGRRAIPDENGDRCGAEKSTVKIDKDLQGLVPGYLQNRREDIRALYSALERVDYESIRVLGHRMKGSGGAYGFDTITEIGKRLEMAAGNQDLAAMRESIQELSQYLSSLSIVTE
jgi:CheY-like chemotaxis protein/HPt (histidine-containing phosphotransfer) domain-containing protein